MVNRSTMSLVESKYKAVKLTHALFLFIIIKQLVYTLLSE